MLFLSLHRNIRLSQYSGHQTKYRGHQIKYSGHQIKYRGHQIKYNNTRSITSDTRSSTVRNNPTLYDVRDTSIVTYDVYIDLQSKAPEA